MYGIEAGKPDPTNQVINHLRFLQRAMDVSLKPESKRDVFVAGMHSLSFRGFLDREVMARTVWAFADSIDVEAEDKLEIDRPLSFSGRIQSVGYLQQEAADVDSIVVGIDGLSIDGQLEEQDVRVLGTDDLVQVHRLHVPVLAIQQGDIKRTLADEIEIVQ